MLSILPGTGQRFRHSQQLEDVRTRQVYGQTSTINKILLVNGEMMPGRITIVLIPSRARCKYRYCGIIPEEEAIERVHHSPCLALMRYN